MTLSPLAHSHTSKGTNHTLKMKLPPSRLALALGMSMSAIRSMGLRVFFQVKSRRLCMKLCRQKILRCRRRQRSGRRRKGRRSSTRCWTSSGMTLRRRWLCQRHRMSCLFPSTNDSTTPWWSRLTMSVSLWLTGSSRTSSKLTSCSKIATGKRHFWQSTPTFAS